MADNPATKPDYNHSEDVDLNFWSTKWPAFARALGGVSALFSGKIFRGTEPDDIQVGTLYGDDNDALAFRFLGSGTRNFELQRNTGTDVAPVWLRIFEFDIGAPTTFSIEADAIAFVGSISTVINGNLDIRGAGRIDIGGGGITTAGAFTGVTGITLISGNVDLAGGDLQNVSSFNAAVSGVEGSLASNLTTRGFVNVQFDAEYGSQTFSLGIDTALAILPYFNPTVNSARTFKQALVSAQGDGTAFAMFNFDDVTPAITALGTIGTNTTLTTGILGGTTGAPGDFTISIHTDKLLYIENQRGSVLDINVSVF